METASTAGLDRMLFIEAERMANCTYDPDDCESERTVIISELQGSENDPDTLLEQEVIAAAYKVHPYRHPTIGWLSDLRTMTRDDLYQYYRRNYVPNNATSLSWAMSRPMTCCAGSSSSLAVFRRVRRRSASALSNLSSSASGVSR